MQTIQYMGSKNKILPFLDDCIRHFIEKQSTMDFFSALDRSVPRPHTGAIFFDAFAGSGRVSYYFRNMYTIISNDKLFFPKAILSAYLNSPYPAHYFQKKIDQLNALPDSYFDQTDGFFTREYGWHENDGKSEDEDGVKKVWLYKNSRKIDMMRHQIAEWKSCGSINENEEHVLLLALILGINKVSNVVGHQNGYLKKWCANAYRDLILEVPLIEANPNALHKHFQGYISTILPAISADIAYFDPPYGTNNKNLSVATRYSSFYHLWNTLVTNRRPDLFGKARKPKDTKGYTEPLERNKRNVVIPKFIRIIEEVQAPIVIFSYSNKSLLTAKDFEEVYRLAGCDMNTFQLYITSHESNNQTKLAHKGGDWINRSNPEAPLTEYLFIACKDPNRFQDPNRTTKAGVYTDIERIDSVEEWLAQEESLDVPEETLVYDASNEIGNIIPIHETEQNMKPFSSL